jgi:type III pantothenate kinase
VDFGGGDLRCHIEGSDYLGGAITRIGIAAEALFSRASKLYRVEIAPPARVIGTNTAMAMQSGIFLGYVALVEARRALRVELGPDMKVIATGGLQKRCRGRR